MANIDLSQIDLTSILNELLSGGGLGKEYISKQYEELWPDIMKKMYSELPPGGIYTGALPYSTRKMATEWGTAKLGAETEAERYAMGLKQAGLGYGLQATGMEQDWDKFLKQLEEERYYWDEYAKLSKELANIEKETAESLKPGFWDYFTQIISSGIKAAPFAFTGG